MKPLFILSLFLLSLNGHSQIYTSSYTQTWPDIFKTDIENINRSISFEENTITMATENTKGKEIEVFYIQKIEESSKATEYFCLTSKDEQIIIIKPVRKELHIIDIFRPSVKTGEQIQLRLHLN